MLTELGLAKVTWQCVHFLSETELDSLKVPGNNIDLCVRTACFSNVQNENELFGHISEAFAFPDYFGANWDALDECLADMSWLPSKGYVLIIEGGELFWNRCTETAGKLVESWLASAEDWADKGVSFHLVFVLN